MVTDGSPVVSNAASPSSHRWPIATQPTGSLAGAGGVRAASAAGASNPMAATTKPAAAPARQATAAANGAAANGAAANGAAALGRRLVAFPTGSVCGACAHVPHSVGPPHCSPVGGGVDGLVAVSVTLSAVKP